ncbi:hypothetical protein V5799_021573 [Amblyomma americanum]|uniref:Uncharacterized protein n=1 Tax=Amblyomma americanum TaxID=6943 RepID=A0AAQ4FPJ8_AMBAM
MVPLVSALTDPPQAHIVQTPDRHRHLFFKASHKTQKANVLNLHLWLLNRAEFIFPMLPSNWHLPCKRSDSGNTWSAANFGKRKKKCRIGRPTEASSHKQ